ncbi:hypothetical protein H6F32_16680 [Anabaena sp. FACHB-1237]|uniref:hypothetical protein n=1 Tax=Anabaena sp. FACHB-1237 TaxID=2692769 RepID=UPI001681A657|nr:hypothetical protein [Anabaena sp. FACHB-1237]MBD2139168.1 hypothetical protein [Anabaena sp. FACHB-1237]
MNSTQHQLFTTLSNSEQESIIGGQNNQVNELNNYLNNIFFQKNDVETEGVNNVTLTTGEKLAQTTKYKFSQVTIYLSFPVF